MTLDLLTANPRFAQAKDLPSVNVVVPIYKGVIETRRCLDSLFLSGLPDTCHVTLINDASPECGMADLLAQYAHQSSVTLLQNETNLGFVASVNRGMTYLSEHDPLLLNSDTEVPYGWVQRLQAALYSAPDIGTVTPFSNNATICSYPRFCQDNSLPADTSLAQIDSLFRQANGGESMDIPTAVGFCMLIRRQCLNQVGLFDVELFGRGYGEENDFCMRAAESGWRHVLCADTFVFHAGAVSFAAEYDARVQQVLELLDRKHPRYSLLVHKHRIKDPAIHYRQRVDALRIAHSHQVTILVISHDLGGGVMRHIQDISRYFDGSVIFLLLRSTAGHQVELTWQNEKEGMRLLFHRERDWEALCEFLRAAGIERIHFHHWLGLPTSIWRLPNECGVPYDVTIHDYYTICPRVNLIQSNGRYCGEPDESACNRCLARTPRVRVGISQWREEWHERLSGAARLLTPSQDTKARIMRYFPDLSCTVAPHPESVQIRTVSKPRTLDSGSVLNIVAIGALSRMKGAEILEACAIDAAERALPLHFHLIGYAWRRLSAPKAWLSITGPYRDDDLPELIAQSNASLAWFPALWPETYSYTLSAAMAAGLPVTVTNLGAPVERLSERRWTWVCDWRWSAREWNDFFMSLRAEDYSALEGFRVKQGELPSKWDWTSDYVLRLQQVPVKNPTRLSQLVELHSRSRLAPVERLMVGLRQGVLMFGLRVRRHAGMKALVCMIPPEIQHSLRRWILGHRD